MKVTYFFIFLITVLIFSACQTDHKNKLSTSQKKQTKTVFVLKQKNVLQWDETLEKILEKNKNFLKLLKEFDKSSYTKEELIDLIARNKKLFQQIRSTHTKTIIDTTAVKSRIVLSEIYSDKLNFLIQKEHIDNDSIQKTFNTITKTLNQIIHQLKIYHSDTDEFIDILQYDSISQARKDSMFINNNHLQSPVLRSKSHPKAGQKIRPKVDINKLRKKIPVIRKRK